jgi:ABC-type Fe3+-hydroxamate transport system substrate-binding protein
VPSLTETLVDLGARDCLAGVTDFCIFPADLALPRLGGTKNPRVEAIRELAPDLVYMNLEENLARHGKAIEEFAPVYVSEPKTVGDVSALITTLGEIHGRRERAAQLTGDLAQALAHMPRREFTFACAIWKEPWMWCGADTYVSSLIEAAGGRNIIRDARYPTRPVDDVRADVIFLPDEPYAFTRADATEARKATGAGVIGPFPGHLFTWHGTRSLLGLRFLAREDLFGP